MSIEILDVRYEIGFVNISDNFDPKTLIASISKISNLKSNTKY